MGEVEIRKLLDRVRARWRRLAVLRAIAQAALAATLVLAPALVAGRLFGSASIGTAVCGAVAIVLAGAAALWGLRPFRENPSDARVARFIEEAEPSLDDRLASAVALASAPEDQPRSAFAESMLSDAARRASNVDPASVVPSGPLRRAGLQAAGALLVLVAVLLAGRGAAKLWYSSVVRAFVPAPQAAETAGAPAAATKPPRVAKIDLEYTFPKELGLAPRIDQDTGDVYAPAGTSVLVRVHADREVASGRMVFGSGASVELAPAGSTELTTTITVREDGSYRVALADRAGLVSSGDTEYFVRTLEDRPPDVHVVRPARDREVTPLEEVDIEARADDDFGVAGMDLVYSIGDGPAKAVPFAIPGHGVSASGTQTLYLEDLKVAPGDFVSYYVRARDVGRGRRSQESRSDLFFLEVRPFDQQFRLADSQGAGGGGSRDIDGLVQAQKEIVVATWKLDRRSEVANATSSDDVRTVGKAESELKTRVEEASSAFRESTMRDPRARSPQRPAPTSGEAAMTAAAEAMGKAAAALDGVKTADAVPPELDALNHLLQAQAEVTERQVQTQQAGNGAASNRSNLDLTNLFDKELQRQQRTNYEAKASSEQQSGDSMLDRIRDLARRQDELNQRQQDLARKQNQMSPDDLKRELEKLTRDQADLRQDTEQAAQQMGAQSSQSTPGSQSARGQQGSQSSQGALRSASQAMSSATNNLRQADPAKASQQGAQASERLRELAQQLESGGAGSPDDRRRALGDLQLEARELADAQRQISSSLQQTPGGSATAAGDTLRRIAGDEDRLAARAGRVTDDLDKQAAAAGADSAATKASAQALAGAARDFDRQRTAERMKQAADAMRASADQPEPGGATPQAVASDEIARGLDRLADSLSAASNPEDADARKLADERTRAGNLRAQIEKLSAEMKQAGTAAEVARLREEYSRAMADSQQLLEQLKREDPSMAQGGMGFTFEGQGMTLSAPGTEAFKQDFAKWDQLRLQATDALGRAETSIDRRLETAAGKERLASGVDDRPPAAYQSQVNSYFKALADRKSP